MVHDPMDFRSPTTRSRRRRRRSNRDVRALQSQLAPAPINALINLAVMYEDRADYVRSERCLRQVLDTHPNHPARTCT
jgi:hypothetical protein